jgi:hypothetical protein
MKAFIFLVSLCAFSLFGEYAHAYLQSYEITNAYFTPTGETSNEILNGNFTIGPPIILVGPGGDIIYPDSPYYKYHAFSLSSESQNIFVGNVESVPPVVLSWYSFRRPDTSADVLDMSSIVLERSISEYGFEGNREYWKYTERILVPVDASNPDSNFLTYENSDDYYPSNIHLLYELREWTGKLIERDQSGNLVNERYETITESDISMGTIVFDATQVPIPGALWFLGSGIIGLIGLRKKLGRQPIF